MTTITDPTPGPWRAVPDARLASVPVYASHGFSIATVWAKHGRFHPTRKTWEEARANASLIAAAPELRAVLAEIIRNTPEIRRDLREKASVALDNAIGGPALRARTKP